MKGDIKAYFADGGHVTLDLKSIKDGKLVGSSENFGIGGFKTSAFSKILFNIYDDRHSGDE